MRVVYKYELTSSDVIIEMPEGSVILKVAEQGESGFIWALHEPEAKKVKRRFVTFGTGHRIDDPFLVFVGTFLTFGEECVWHVFEKSIGSNVHGDS
jgi:hypothetical protein